MTTSDQLIAVIETAVLEKQIINFDLFLVIADLLEEEGDYPLSVVFRWCSRNKKVPYLNPRWGWALLRADTDYSFPGHWVDFVDKWDEHDDKRDTYFTPTLRERLQTLIPFIGEMQS